MPELRVLIIDDEPAIARALRPALKGQGFEVATALTGAEGLAQLESFSPNLILLDLGLPDIDGVDLTAQLTNYELPIHRRDAETQSYFMV